VLHPSATAVRSCDASLVSASRGEQDADDAIAKTLAEGFSTGSVVFSTWSTWTRCPRQCVTINIAWTRRILTDGRFRAGIYAHTHNADVIYADVRAAYEAAGIHDNLRSGSPERVTSHHRAGERRRPRPSPLAWQGILDHTVSHAGIRSHRRQRGQRGESLGDVRHRQRDTFGADERELAGPVAHPDPGPVLAVGHSRSDTVTAGASRRACIKDEGVNRIRAETPDRSDCSSALTPPGAIL